MKSIYLLMIGLVSLFSAGLAVGEAPVADQNVELRLRGAAMPEAGDAHDLIIELRLRDGRWEPTVRGMTFGMGQGRHIGRVTGGSYENGSGRLEVEMKIRRDYWTNNGGRGVYQITFEPAEDGRGLVGRYTGRYERMDLPQPAAPKRGVDKPKPKQDLSQLPLALRRQVEEAAEPAAFGLPVDTGAVTARHEVSGQVEGQYIPRWPSRVADHQPVQPGEYPRLIFRKADVPRLRTLAQEHPVGQAIMARTLEILERQPAHQDDKFTSWPAVGFGFAWQMTGEQKYADRAKAIIEKNILAGTKTGQDIHHGPRLMGLALAFDLCYDGWDEAFRQRCVDEIQQRTLELATGTFQGGKMGGFNPSWWSNHNGIRVSAAGLGALAILGEKNSDGQVLEEAEAIADQMAWEVRGYIRDACGGGSWGIEGMFYKGMTLRRGLLSMCHAYPRVTGKNIVDDNWGSMLIVGYFQEAEPGHVWSRETAWKKGGILADKSRIDGDALSDIVWSMGTGLVPADYMPAVKYLLDREVGLQGDKTFGIPHGIFAPYAMAGYPFDVEAKDPATILPWFSPDPRTGHWVFRKGFNTPDDILFTLNHNSRQLGASHSYRSGPTGEWRLSGLGHDWLLGIYHPRIADFSSAIAHLNHNGPQTIGWQQEGRIATMRFDASPMYMPPLERTGRDKTPTETLIKARGGLQAWLPDHPWSSEAIDFGIRATRDLLVDTSGESGVPLLIVIAEQVGRLDALDGDLKPSELLWRLPLITEGATTTVTDNILIAKRENATMQVTLSSGTFDAGTYAAKIPDGRVMAVITLTVGDPPAVKFDDQTATIGSRSVRWTEAGLRW